MFKHILAAVLLVSLTVAAASVPKEVSVTSRQGNVKVKPDHMSKNVTVVVYGDKLKVVTKENDWYQVTTPSGKTGWIHVSATTTKKINIARDSKVGDGSAGNDEVALAGKGLNQQVEQAYIKNNPQMAKAFQQVDEIEAVKISPEQLAAFITQGQLK